MVSEGIENWVGTPKISGIDLAKTFTTHLEALKGETVTLALGEKVTSLAKDGDVFTATTASGKTYSAKAVLIASGAGRRKLDVPGAAKFENKGVTYCASCDGPLFSGMDVIVVGGGNAGFETATQLLAYTTSVTLIHRHKDFKADPITVEKVRANPKMHIITHAEPTEVIGEGNFVTGMKYIDKDSGETKELKASGIFVEAGVIPNTEFVGDLLALDQVKRIVVNPRNQRAYAVEPSKIAADARHGQPSDAGVHGRTVEEQGRAHNAADGVILEGVWAAGDVTDELYHQNNIAAGDGVKALEDIYLWVKTR